MSKTIIKIDPELDLVLERVIDIPRNKVWDAWTKPEQLKRWFTPDPYQTIDCEIDLRPGGMFRTVMRSPEGQDFNNMGCYLEVVENERLAWTDALLPGFRPAMNSGFGPKEIGVFTAIIVLEDVKGGTKYTAYALHQNPTARKNHEEMGFAEGWGAALDQLVAMVKGQR